MFTCLVLFYIGAISGRCISAKIPATLNSTTSSKGLQPEERLLYIGFLASNSIWFAMMLSSVKFPWKKQILSKSHGLKNTAPQGGVPEKKLCYPPCVKNVQYVYIFSTQKYSATQSAASPLRRVILGYPKFAQRAMRLCSTLTNPSVSSNCQDKKIS